MGRDVEERDGRDEEIRQVGGDMRQGAVRVCEKAGSAASGERDFTRQGTFEWQGLTRSGSDKAKRGHDIDDQGRDKIMTMVEQVGT